MFAENICLENSVHKVLKILLIIYDGTAQKMKFSIYDFFSEVLKYLGTEHEFVSYSSFPVGIICSKLAIETLEQGVKYVQRKQ